MNLKRCLGNGKEAIKDYEVMQKGPTRRDSHCPNVGQFEFYKGRTVTDIV